MRDFSNINTFYTITKKVDFFPPWKKCVKKIYECSVKKENLFDPDNSFVSFCISKATKT